MSPPSPPTTKATETHNFCAVSCYLLTQGQATNYYGLSTTLPQCSITKIHPQPYLFPKIFSMFSSYEYLVFYLPNIFRCSSFTAEYSLVQISAQTPALLTGAFSVLSQSFHINASITPQIRHGNLLLQPFRPTI
jgi:hypothetical protein